ncbi:pre-mRNA-splicing factor CWC25 homolog [Rhodamnia argentea]|uniref:Pre-mRNA-splicing factor CWC25 homolog n=1 Tax=Rhodamnia argentea TaxID=178133 RepID=A0A8B8QJP7_9MYRT|nr:pre-mRNA-splicing factor CWC25 homolog [Rhodamnia argentea]
MALKFLNKKGWHTGSLRNIENVWKAEQKHDAEQKKLEELRKQIQEERERDEFRVLQEQAGILPRQERLEFLYDSGLAVGKGSSEGVAFKALDKPNEAASSSAASASASASGPASATPGALFEDKSYSANDAWRKLHSDPLLLIRQREQEALARIKNNPVQMAMIRKSVMEKNPDKDHDKKVSRKKHRHRSSKREKRSSSSEPVDSDDASRDDRKAKRKSTNQSSDRDGRHKKAQSDSDDDLHGRESWKKRRLEDSKHERSSDGSIGVKRGKDDTRYPHKYSRHENNDLQSRDASRRESRSSIDASRHRGDNFQGEGRNESQYKRRNAAPKLSEEERLARLREMQMDAELHEEQRWKRLKRADADDARELKRDAPSRGRNFLDAVQKTVYGAEKGGNLTIEESVRRRTYYSQGRSETGEGNAFRR